MTLLSAPFAKSLRVLDLSSFGEEVRLVLIQLGLDAGEVIEKLHVAPLGDPVSLRVGQQVFTLRRELCGQIEVALA